MSSPWCDVSPSRSLCAGWTVTKTGATVWAKHKGADYAHRFSSIEEAKRYVEGEAARPDSPYYNTLKEQAA